MLSKTEWSTSLHYFYSKWIEVTNENFDFDRAWNNFCCKNAGALRKFHVIEGQNARHQIPYNGGYKRGQIAFYAFHSFLVEVQTKLATCVPDMRNINLEFKIAKSPRLLL